MPVSLHVAAWLSTHVTMAGPPHAQPGVAASPTPSGTMDINAPAGDVPGLGPTLTHWISWAKSIGMFAGVIGLIICGIMMMVGRRNRSHLAAEGASGIVWVIAGASVIALAPSLISSLM